MTIAIFGNSSVGKTTIGNALAEQLSLPCRSCGAVVRDLATQRGVPFDAVSDDDHIKIDRETVDWAIANPNGVIEGRFLDFVLKDLAQPVTLIKITASLSVRAERHSQRTKTAVSGSDLQKVDKDDQLFRNRLFGMNSTSLEPRVLLDSSERDVKQCVEFLILELNQL